MAFPFPFEASGGDPAMRILSGLGFAASGILLGTRHAAKAPVGAVCAAVAGVLASLQGGRGDPWLNLASETGILLGAVAWNVMDRPALAKSLAGWGAIIGGVGLLVLGMVAMAGIAQFAWLVREAPGIVLEAEGLNVYGLMFLAGCAQLVAGCAAIVLGERLRAPRPGPAWTQPAGRRLAMLLAVYVVLSSWLTLAGATLLRDLVEGTGFFLNVWMNGFPVADLIFAAGMAGVGFGALCALRRSARSTHWGAAPLAVGIIGLAALAVCGASLLALPTDWLGSSGVGQEYRVSAAMGAWGLAAATMLPVLVMRPWRTWGSPSPASHVDRAPGQAEMPVEAVAAPPPLPAPSDLTRDWLPPPTATAPAPIAPTAAPVTARRTRSAATAP